jgi:hypothetical protein
MEWRRIYDFDNWLLGLLGYCWFRFDFIDVIDFTFLDVDRRFNGRRRNAFTNFLFVEERFDPSTGRRFLGLSWFLDFLVFVSLRSKRA